MNRFIATAILLISPLHAVPDFYVNHLATGANDGSSWTNAYTKLEDALRQLNGSTTTDIWVAAGTYYPDEGEFSNEDDKNSSFSSVSNMTLLGGFAGNETLADQRDPKRNVTILSGDITQDDIDPDQDGIISNPDHIVGENADNVLYLGAGAENILIDGFTMTATNRAPVDYFSASATIANCHIIGAKGNGIFGSRSHIIVENTIIEQCSRPALQVATNGSVQASNCQFSNSGSPLAWLTSGEIGGSFTNCRFFSPGKTLISSGMAITHYGDLPLSIRSCLFYSGKNTSSGSTVIQIDSPAASHISNCTFYGFSGSALSNTFANPSVLTFANNIVWNSPADTPQINHPSATISHSLIQNENPAGTGNIDGTLPENNPLFTHPASNDFHLRQASPAQNAGDNDIATESTDLDGAPRIINNMINLGPFELTREPIPTISSITNGENPDTIQIIISELPSQNLILQESTDLINWNLVKTLTTDGENTIIPVTKNHPTAYFRLTRPE